MIEGGNDSSAGINVVSAEPQRAYERGLRRRQDEDKERGVGGKGSEVKLARLTIRNEHITNGNSLYRYRSYLVLPQISVRSKRGVN